MRPTPRSSARRALGSLLLLALLQPVVAAPARAGQPASVAPVGTSSPTAATVAAGGKTGQVAPVGTDALVHEGGVVGALEDLGGGAPPTTAAATTPPRPLGAPDPLAIPSATTIAPPTSSATAQAPTGRVTITASVGRGGVNRPDDVRTIRAALAARGYPTADATSQACDAGLVGAIERFQRERAGFRFPDGRVDLAERTLRALNGEAVAADPATIDGALGEPAALTPAQVDPVATAPTTGVAGVGTGATTSLGAPDDAAPATRMRTPGREGPRVPTPSAVPPASRGDLGPAASGVAPAAAYEALDALGVPYVRLPATLGVADPVRVTPPILGVDWRYTTHDRSRPLDIDVRLALALAHASQALRAQGVVRVLHMGAHVTDRGDGHLRTADHARGLAIDIGSFVVRTASGERTIDVAHDWLTGRSTTHAGGGVAGVVRPTEAEVAGMNADERWLRQAWGLLKTEFDIVVTPSHNQEHWNHLHCGLSSIGSQRARSMASFAAAGYPPS